MAFLRLGCKDWIGKDFGLGKGYKRWNFPLKIVANLANVQEIHDAFPTSVAGRVPGARSLNMWIG